MTGVQQAKEIIRNSVNALSPQIKPLNESAALALAKDIYAPINLPLFRQSSMDGYAFSYADWERLGLLEVTGESAAGAPSPMSLKSGTAMRIFTGAAVPEGADTVVMQEKVLREGNFIKISDKKLEPAQHVRSIGADIKAGDLAIARGSLLTPAVVGYLAALGIDRIPVIPSPSVTIVITGKEVQLPGTPLASGKVYESNSFSLKAALHRAGVNDISIHYSDDNLDELTGVLGKCIEQSDLVLITGGVSVGDYDYVVQAANNCGITQGFHKVKQRPGKPLFFGRHGSKIIFGLPGNPSSALTCFYQYVLIALEKLTRRQTTLPQMKASLAKPIQKPPDLTCFLRGLHDGEFVHSLEGQESFKLAAFAKANCLIEMGEGVENCAAGDEVLIHLISY